ncbi:alanine racemase [Streptomyces sp. CoH27]|uniref:alanine racemase n=1 Tax=Streptomyces sp. CoH27 TaxID=2875763 RepID=UPI001CD2D950|nr:alanine racemase [Streptomyces sp. CoH27]
MRTDGSALPTGFWAPTEDETRLLLHRAGRTPVFVYGRAALRAAVDRVRAASLPGAHIYYSLKANPHPGVVTALTPLVDGFDVCSLAELETALNSGMPAARTLFTGPAKTRAEAAAALAAGAALTVESPGQARLMAEVADELGVAGRAVVRLNTPYPGRGPGSPPSPHQFGVAEADLGEVVDVLRRSALTLRGLHLFFGSQYADADVIRAARRAALERARDVEARYGLKLAFVSVGGGIALPWCAADPDVDWAGLTAPEDGPLPWGDHGDQTVVAEYGRSIAGPAGVLLTSVLDVKTVGDRRYVVVDAGINHLFTAGRLVAGRDRGEPLVRAVGTARPDRPVDRAYVTGPLCSQLDVLAEDVPLPPVAVGDTLMFLGVGAYGPTFSPSGFLSRDQAGEIVH